MSPTQVSARDWRGTDKAAVPTLLMRFKAMMQRVYGSYLSAEAGGGGMGMKGRQEVASGRHNPSVTALIYTPVRKIDARGWTCSSRTHESYAMR